MKASSRRTSPTRKRWWIVGGVLVLLISWYLLPRFFTGVAALVWLPIEHTKAWFVSSAASVPQYFRDRSALLSEKEDLERKLAALSGVAMSNQKIRRENDDLRHLLSNDDTPRIAASVIARPPTLPYDVILIDRGEASGVEPGAPVFIGSDQVLGVVSETFWDSALVLLATSPGVESTVFVIGPDIYTTASGRGGGVLEVSVPQGVPLRENDLVVMPVLGAGIYGQIGHIESHPTRPDQTAYVTPAVPLASLRFVSVGPTADIALDFLEIEDRVEKTRILDLTVPVPVSELVVSVGSTTTVERATSSESE